MDTPSPTSASYQKWPTRSLLLKREGVSVITAGFDANTAALITGAGSVITILIINLHGSNRFEATLHVPETLVVAVRASVHLDLSVLFFTRRGTQETVR